jgi:hypothetical protein
MGPAVVQTSTVGDFMPDTRDPQSVILAAEQAAVGGDYASAERLLREAADLQEASLGPLHPELANTLNNLGVVYEVTEKPDEAERCFRRASEIATAVLPPDHPFVATSRQNLDDFLKTREKLAGLPIPPPVPVPAPPAVSAPVPPPVPTPAPPPVVLRTAETGDTESVTAAPQLTTSHRSESVAPRTASRSTAVTPSVEHRTMPRPIAIGALVAGGLVVVLVAGRLWFGGSDKTESSATPGAAPVESEAPAAEPKPIAPAPASEPPAGAATKKVSPKETIAGRAGAAAANQTKPSVQKPSPVVAGAQLCRDLITSGNWRCDSPGNPVPSGRLLFYTRVKSQTDTTIQHRWYQGDRLRKSANLEIAANPGSGYRTFSRHTVTSGEWRVELRTRDGVLLHEERFNVR